MKKDCIPTALFSRAVGRITLDYLDSYHPEKLAEDVDYEALQLLSEILDILDDKSCDDPECFYRIDRIVRAFHARSISTSRHWELE